MITGFVFMMMLVIEYLNVISRGVWQRGLRGGRWRQYLLASFLGATPGCLGAFAVVSLYAHGEISLGALVAAMVATSGDESFVMLSMIPQKALLVFVLLFFIGIAAGYLTDVFFGARVANQAVCNNSFDVHEEEVCHCFPWGHLREQWAQCSFARGILGGIVLLFLTLFVENTIPFSIFLASSIVQDGHGMLPLLAESRRDFLWVKAINFSVGLLVGCIGYVFRW